MLRILLVSLALVALPAVDDVEKELTRWQDEVGKARGEYQTEVAKANEKAVKALTRVAQREAKAGDIAAATDAWRAVLAIDLDAEEARAFFTAIGRLDEVMAEVAAGGDPLAGLGGAVRPALVFSPGAALMPSGTLLQTPFDQRTIELVVGKTVGDGVLYEEGNDKAGLAIAVVGDEVRFIIAAGTERADLSGAFDRLAPWTHLAVQFNEGEVSLWIGGKLAQKAKGALTTFPKHDGEGGLGCERKGSVAGMPKNTLSFRCSMFRMSKVARFTTTFQPASDAITDKTTLLAIGSENLSTLVVAPVPVPPVAPPAKVDADADDDVDADADAGGTPDEPPKVAAKGKPAKVPPPAGVRIKAFANVPDDNIAWQVLGDVFLATK